MEHRNRLSASERQTQILEKAQELCARKGFAGTTLDDIAREAGVSRALVIQYFGRKEHIYEALVDHLFQHHPLASDPSLRGFIEKRDDEGVFRAFSMHLLRFVSKEKDHSPLRLIYYSMLEKPDLYERYFQNRRTKALKILEDYIADRIKEGGFREFNPRDVATGFMAMLSTLLFQQVTVPQLYDEASFVSTVDTMIGVLLNGLKRTE